MGAKDDLRGLADYIQASRESYDACVGSLPELHDFGDLTATAHFNFLKLDGNGRPKLDALAECLAIHLVNYALSARRTERAEAAITPAARAREYSRLHMQARRLLREHDTSGECGEMLLYLILEVVLGAPQVVAKMELKTNPRVEVHGSDGIHMRYDEAEDCLDVFFGESKLEQTVSGAVRSAFKSVEEFHDHRMERHEVGLVTSNFKHANAHLQKAVARYLDDQQNGAWRINHAILIGYNTRDYERCVASGFRAAQREFVRAYGTKVPRLAQLVARRLREYRYKHLRFRLFFMPFSTVEEFRAAFYAALDA